MKKMSLLFACMLMLTLVSGCDFFRGLAGRPSSKDIEAKRARLELAARLEAARQDSVSRARADSIAAVRKAEADSLHALDTLTLIGKYHKASSYVNIPQSRLRSRYAVVTGVFSSEHNARKLSDRYAADGFDSYVLKYRSTLCAVLVSPCNRVADALAAYRSIRALPYSSKETWILVNE